MKPQYKALIVDTILKEARSKTLIFIFVATTAAIILGHLVLTALNSQAGDAAFSLTGVNVLSVNFKILNSISFIIAAIFGVSVFRSDFQNNIIYQYLTFPIDRTEYFFIRVLGTWILVLGYYAYSYLLSGILFSVAFKKMIFTPWHLYSFAILGIYLLLVIFISIFFSLLMNKMGALFVTFCTCAAAAWAYGTFSKIPYSEFFNEFTGGKAISLLFYYFFPRITFLDYVSSSLLAGEAITGNIAEQVIHLIIISGCYVYLANYLVKKKDF